MKQQKFIAHRSNITKEISFTIYKFMHPCTNRAAKIEGSLYLQQRRIMNDFLAVGLFDMSGKQ